MDQLCLFCQYSRAVEEGWFCSREHEKLYEKMYKARLNGVVLENNAMSRKERALIDAMLKGAKTFAEKTVARMQSCEELSLTETERAEQSWRRPEN